MKNSPVLLSESSPSMFAAIGLIATDMDGTLTKQGHFTPTLVRSLAALAEAQLSTLIVTGRSAGWVQGIVAYLPVAGAIAENGGIYIPKATWDLVPLVDVPDITEHRHALANRFRDLQATFPNLQPSADNRFRLTDWTFDIGDLTPLELEHIANRCAAAGWGFTYSTVQCHIRPAAQDKGVGLQQVLQRDFPQLSNQEVVTVGDSPNDEGLFDARLFPISVGVANVRHYCDRLHHVPRWITPSAEVNGFEEVVSAILAAKGGGEGMAE
jgi:HAD superfamily hydrolase (TIGR01484 family)